MDPTTTQRAAAAPRRPVPVGSTDERVLALLATRGPSSVAEVCEALRLGHVSASLSLDRLREEGAARVSAVTRRNAEVWEEAKAR